jgi:ketosteroid isomerase-like protein
MLDTQDAIVLEPRLEQVMEIDKDRVLAILPDRIQGRSSGVVLSEERLGAIVTVRDGKIIRTEVYPSPEAALKAAGVEG